MGTNKSGSELDYHQFEERVLETVKSCQRRKEPPLVWAMEVAKCVLSTAGLGLPSAELAQVVVSQLCFTNNHPSLWKFLHQALSSGLLCPIHVLALLTSRAIPHRWSQPGVYRLYLELLSRYALSYDPLITDACRVKITKSVDVALQLSQTYNIEIVELGHALVLYFFSIVFRLVDSIADDWESQMKSTVDGALGITKSDHMDVDSVGNHFYESNEHQDAIIAKNSFMALEVLGKLTDNQKAVVLLRLVHLNMPEKFDGLLKRIQTLEAHKLLSSNASSISQLLSRLSENIRKALNVESERNKRHLIGMLTDIGSCKPSSSSVSEAGWFACWVPFDICMENVMDGKQFPVTSAIDILSETISTLQVFNRASWQETFLALWVSALRLVQRERDPLEGPVPHLEARLCVLLSITPLAIAHVLGKDSTCSKRRGLISSLQVVGQYQALLCPPISVTSAANTAAGKAASFISKTTSNTTNGTNGGGYGETRLKAGGDMRHLIVEACIARKLIDTSAYFWPGYVSQLPSLSDQSTLQIHPWSTFMEGASLTGPLVNALITTPASSLAEIEKIYHVALSGSEEEKSTAAKILCGASLTRGWNIQERVVHFVVKLLCPPVPPNFSGPNSHLVECMPMLSAILSAASSVDTVHILSLHGMVPEVAASLMPLCETFGSLVPTPSQKSCTHNESSSVYMVFSSAFLFLLRLWKFYKPPLEQCITGRGGWIGGELTLEYLLLLRNSRIANKTNNTFTSDRPIYIDDYPKLRAWYCQNKSCLDSTLSGLLSGNPVHQVANKILTMIYWKMTKSGTPASSNSSSGPTSTSPSANVEDACQRPMLPAWEVLEAVPYVLEAILTACAHGRLSSRDLTTGLRDLVDFLPASLATIISYFSAEVTRGIWKPVLMNGTDWPSPAPNFSSVESEIKDILAAAGVTIPTYSSSGVSPAMLPLPMAALVSLTITFKLDKSLEYIHAVAGLALENCASGCPWPGMPIIGSLWTQKVRRWYDFIVVSCSRSVFRQNREAVSQLLRSCFSSFIGSSPPNLSNQSGVNGLLGSFISAQGLQPRVAPGFLYLRSCRTINHVQYVNNVILGLVSEFARELAGRWANAESSPRLKSTQASLAVATARAKEVATLGASLLCVAGGLQLVQELYLETMPTWLLSAREEKRGEGIAVSRIVEGYAMAYFLVLSGAMIWGADSKQPPWALSKRCYLVGSHMDFVAGVLEGNISLGCDPATWKAYVSCLVGLMVSFAPLWIEDVKKETLRKLGDGLRGWHECELALSLLERGGQATMGYVAELLN